MKKSSLNQNTLIEFSLFLSFSVYIKNAGKSESVRLMEWTRLIYVNILLEVLKTI